MENFSTTRPAMGEGAPDGAQLQHNTNGAQNSTVSNGYPDAPTPAATRGALDAKHRQQLETDSGLCADAIETRGYFTQTDRQALKLLGFEAKQCLIPALVIPLYNWRGEVAGHALRPDIPRNVNGKALKYEVPKGSTPVLDVAPLTASQIGDPAKPLLITEGAKKADSAASRGLCTINLSGVYGWRGRNAQGGTAALADWENIVLKERAVYVAFDSDVSTKPQIEGALTRLFGFLQSRGALVKVVYFPDGPNGAKTGLDDFFARGGDVAGLFSLARDLAPLDESKRKRREAEKAEKRAQIESSAKDAGALVIETNNRQQADELKDLSRAIEALNARTPALFFGFDGLVKIARDAEGVPRLKSANRSTIQAIAGRAAHWIRSSEREGTSNVAPPRDLCEIYLDDQDSWKGILPIQGTVSAPFIAPDGTLCVSTGYHSAARLWLELPANFDLGDTTPTPGNIESARQLLLHELLGEVAFADAASRAHAIAQMILPFARNLVIGPTPLHLWNAPLRSSGKSYAAEICIAPFCKPAPMPEKRSPEEWRKSLLAELQTGPSHIFLDNLKGNLDSAALDMAITSGVFRDRKTGTGEMVSAPARCVWVATANNAELTQDAATRAVLIQIDPNCENPEARAFCSDPHRFIRRNRGRVCGAILTLVRAWQDAGKPNYSGPNRCRFPEWARVMGGILEVAGVGGFLDNITEQRAISSDTSNEWHEFTALWLEMHGEALVGTRELLALALKVNDIAALLEKAQTEAAKNQALGQMLKKRRDRVFGELKIKSGPISRNRATFRLQKLDLGQKEPKSDGVDGVHGVLSGSTRNPVFLPKEEEKAATTEKPGFRVGSETTPLAPSTPSLLADLGNGDDDGEQF